MNPDHPPLSRSYKGRFPFRLATTSFIYPDGYAANVAMLAPFVDEIELLLFESRGADSLPARTEIRHLQRLADAHRIDYSVHLPIDVNPGSADPEARRHAVDALRRSIEISSELDPRSYILHLPYSGSRSSAETLHTWQDRTRLSLRHLIAGGVPARRLCVENLDYPMAWFVPLVQEFKLALCLDIGHLIRQGIQPLPVFDRFRDEIAVVHLHGVENGRDHLALTERQRDVIQPLVPALQSFRGSLSLEVFDFKNLDDSLAFLAKLWQTGPESQRF